MSSPRRSSQRSGAAQQLAAKRERVAELQELIAAERAAIQDTNSRKKEVNDARRILEAAKQFTKFSKLFNNVCDLPDNRGEQLMMDHSAADREQKERLAQLEQQLARESERQRQLQLRLEQLLSEMPPASQARQQLRRDQNNPAVQREYTTMLQQFGDLTHLYNVVEKLMVASDYPWLDSVDWMDRIRPAYHALPPPSHVLRADLHVGSEDGSDAGSGGSEESSPP